MAALITLTVYWFFFFTYFLGMLAVTQPVGGEFHSHFILAEVMAFSSEEGIGVGWGGDAALWLPLALAALAFIAASRIWRIFRYRSA